MRKAAKSKKKRPGFSRESAIYPQKPSKKSNESLDSLSELMNKKQCGPWFIEYIGMEALL